jgi:hypothetical protein
MSMPLIGLLFWLVMTVVGWLIWRSGDRVGGRMVVLPAAISSVGAAGMWFLSIDLVRPGYALGACSVAAWMVVLWRTDSAVLRQMGPVLALGGAVVAAIWLTELASWMGASRNTIVALLVQIVVLATAFIVWMLVSTFRLLRVDLRARRVD